MPPTALFNKEVESADYLDKHEPLIHQQWNGGLPQYRTDPTAEIVEFINSTVGDLGPEKLGRAIPIGMSSGGRNTATVADQIKGRRLFPYVAAIDAAFDDIMVGPFVGIMAWVAWQGPTCCSVPAGCSPYRARRSRQFRSACRWPVG